MAYRNIAVNNNDELDISSTEFIYQIKNYYVPTFTNNTILCRVVKSGQYVYNAEQLFTFASYGTSGTDYSLTITPASNQAAVLDNLALPLSVKLFDHNGDQITDVSINLTFKDKVYNGIHESDPVIVGGVAPNVLVSRLASDKTYGYAVLKASTTIPITYNADGSVANNSPTLSDPDTLVDGATDAAAAEVITKNITLEAYYPIPWSAGNYYIEGASTVVYDSLGSNPSYYPDPYVLYDMDTNIKVENQEWSINCFPKT
mgnify:CR=1 FL=1